MEFRNRSTAAWGQKLAVRMIVHQMIKRLLPTKTRWMRHFGTLAEADGHAQRKAELLCDSFLSHSVQSERQHSRPWASRPADMSGFRGATIWPAEPRSTRRA
jgi:hypothetical protein